MAESAIERIRASLAEAGGTAGNAGQGDSGNSSTDNSSSGGPSAIDPKTFGENRNGSDQPEKRKRGRPPGSGRKQTGEQSTGPQKVPLHLESLNSLLFSCHLLLSKAIKTPELELDQKEAEKMAEAMANVAKHYPVNVSEKAMAWTNLALALCAIYGPRAYVIGERKKKERETRQTQAQPQKQA